MIVYLVVFVSLYRLKDESEIPILQKLQITDMEYILIMMAIAGLVNRIVKGLVLGFVQITTPFQFSQQIQGNTQIGFWISWVVAFLILLAVLSSMKARLMGRNTELADESTLG